MESKRFSSWGDLGIMTAIFFAAAIIARVCMAGFMAMAPAIEREAVMFIAYTAQFSLAIVGAIIWLRRRDGVKLRFGVGWSAGPAILWGVVLITAASITLEPLIDLFPEHYLESLNDMIGRGGWAIMLTVVAAPVLEEIFFRGLVLESLSRRWSATAAVVASAAIFGAAHFPILPQMVNALVVSILLGYLYLATRSLIPVIVIHAVNNALAYMILELTGSQNTDTREMIGNDTIYWTVYAASAAIVIVSLIIPVAKTNNKTPKTALLQKDE
jgi:membrane protease YdiL (CAAX protease family)